MPDARPQRTRSYRNHLLDGTRWDRYRPRDGDVVVATPYKSGTTWALAVVRELFALGEELPPFREMWLDCRFRQSADAFFDELEAQRHRRYIKSHLALDGVPYHEDVRYIVVGRDPRDVFMSFWNHYNAMAAHLDRYNEGWEGPPLPPPPDDIHIAWRDWIGRGWFAWESEGYPFWGNLHHVRTWWRWRHLENILVVHFDDLKRDLGGQIRRIGRHLGVDVPDAALAAIRAAVDVDRMRRTMVEQQNMAGGDPAFARAFFRYRGANGRWRDVLDAGELELYERTAATLLDPACRAWLEGRGGGE